MIRLVSVSGGKDSTACLLLALERHPREEVRAVFADTGNEHPATYEFVRYLGEQTGVEITWLRQDFTEWWWRRRDYVRDKWPEKGVSPEVVTRAVALFDLGPSGNPYLDLCCIKGRFPSRMAQFCTQSLKTEPLMEHALDLIDHYGAVESWQGVRAEESANRAKLPERDDRGGGYSIYRPILKWTAAQVFDLHRAHGIEPNPLYKQGMRRVGCMPCINVAKDELLEISKRFSEHIDRIEQWEAIVGQFSKRQRSTFLAGANDGQGLLTEQAYAKANIREMVRWSQTKRGGKLLDMFRITDEPAACASAYGLCE